jgi:hypothetical protein
MREREQNGLQAGAETADIELSAEELFKLSRAPASSVSRAAVASARRFRASHVALACAASVLFVAVGLGAGYGFGNAGPAAPPLPVPEPVVVRASRMPVVPDEPVRVRNPFDKKEVFEFPAGTSAEEAQDAVAAILLERARERQALFASKKRQAKRRQT